MTDIEQIIEKVSYLGYDKETIEKLFAHRGQSKLTPEEKTERKHQHNKNYFPDYYEKNKERLRLKAKLRYHMNKNSNQNNDKSEPEEQYPIITILDD